MDRKLEPDSGENKVRSPAYVQSPSTITSNSEYRVWSRKWFLLGMTKKLKFWIKLGWQDRHPQPLCPDCRPLEPSYNQGCFPQIVLCSPACGRTCSPGKILLDCFSFEGPSNSKLDAVIYPNLGNKTAILVKWTLVKGLTHAPSWSAVLSYLQTCTHKLTKPPCLSNGMAILICFV